MIGYEVQGGRKTMWLVEKQAVGGKGLTRGYKIAARSKKFHSLLRSCSREVVSVAPVASVIAR